MSKRLISLCCGLIFAPASLAQLFQPLQLARSLETSIAIGAAQDGDTAAGPASGAWSVSLQSEVAAPAESGLAWAAQYSVIGQDYLDVYGLTRCLAQIQTPNGPTAATGRSTARIAFALSQRGSVNLIGQLDSHAERELAGGGFSNLHADVEVRLARFAGAELFRDSASVDIGAADPDVQSDASTLAFAAELAPGIYELEVVATSVITAGFDVFPNLLSSTGFIVSIDAVPAPPSAPCNADLDGDGDVDVVDFSLMQSCFTGPQP